MPKNINGRAAALFMLRKHHDVIRQLIMASDDLQNKTVIRNLLELSEQ